MSIPGRQRYLKLQSHSHSASIPLPGLAPGTQQLFKPHYIELGIQSLSKAALSISFLNALSNNPCPTTSPTSPTCVKTVPDSAQKGAPEMELNLFFPLTSRANLLLLPYTHRALGARPGTLN